jgi:CubicO group peptidase (beta-lactamase class C family)
MRNAMKPKIAIAFLLIMTLSAVAAGADSVPLPRSSPEKQGISSAAILSFIEAADEKIDTMNSFIMLRHGQVLAEGWWAPYESSAPHVLFSLSKSFTSTAVGLAIAEGKLSLNDEVLKFFPQDAPVTPSANLKAMRVHDLLRMSAGHQAEVQFGPNDIWTRAFLNHPVPFKPGTHFLYNTPATYMLSAIVQRVTGMTVLDYLRPRLMDPLGIQNPTWDKSPQGISLGGYGLSVRTEDIARFGQLYLQKGKWQGRQLVPADWVAGATSRQTSNGSNPASDWDQGYGYQFWRCRNNVYRGDGAFGQYCIVMPDQDAVIAITSGIRNMQAVLDLIWEKLLPAMKTSPLPADKAAEGKLRQKMESLTVKSAEGKASSPMAAAVSGKRFIFPENNRGIESAVLDFASGTTILTIKTRQGESRIPCGRGTWIKGKAGFTNGLDSRSMPVTDHLSAATGAWASDDIYGVKLVLYDTPFYVNLAFRFKGDEVLFDSEYNAWFGPTVQPQLIGSVK